MSVIKFSWHVNDLDEVMIYFDEQKVYRGPSTVGPWTEVTGPGTRVALVAGTINYDFTDTAGSSSYYYASSYFNSGTLEESDRSDPVRGEMYGYIDIQDIRDEGFLEEDYSDAQVAKAIKKATKQIERVTRRFFEPRELTIRLNGEDEDRLELLVPLIAIMELKLDGNEIESSDVVIYNRHLTQGLAEPDDRRWSRIEYRSRTMDNRSMFGVFTEGQQNVQVHGYFGYTELSPGDPIGETEEGSQIPLSYGDTPELIKSACTLLTLQYMFPAADGDADEYRRRTEVVRMKTRDQEIEYNRDTTEGSSTGNLTGDPVVDRLLSSFVAPNPVVSV
jgi:hypothetical protein